MKPLLAHAVLFLLVAGSSVRAQGTFSTSSEIRDTAGLFSKDAIKKATDQIVAIERKYRVPVTIESIESLKGEPISEAILVYAKRLGPQAKGVFVLMSKNDHRLDVVASKDYPELDPRPKRIAIRDAFLDEFRKDNYDLGLSRGIEAIEKTLAAARPAAPLPTERPSMIEPRKPTTLDQAVIAPAVIDPSGLVVRNQVRLSLGGARFVLANVEAKAKELGYKMNIAVVDDGGHLMAFARMDGARPASANTALTKAITAATFRAATGPLPAGAAAPDILLNLSVQNAAAASGGKITTLLGGIPIVVDGQVIGAVGVGGGSGEQDAEVAKSGVAAFLTELQSAKTPAK